MLFKADYLAGRGTCALKDSFRRLQLSGEAQMDAASVSAASPFAWVSLAAGAPRRWRKIRRSNALHLIRALADWEAAQPLFPRLPQEVAPFGVVLVFPSPVARDWYREKLRRRSIYCPIHWEASATASAASRELAARILTIPCDQRYTIDDMRRVATILCRGRQRVQ
jgi:hypothetical protein